MSARTRQRRGASQTGPADFLRLGDFNRICDRCGFKYKASQTFKEWNGLIVCRKCYEPRHPQDFIRGRRDRQGVKEARPDTEIFTGIGPNGRIVLRATTNAAGISVAGRVVRDRANEIIVNIPQGTG